MAAASPGPLPPATRRTGPEPVPPGGCEQYMPPGVVAFERAAYVDGGRRGGRPPPVGEVVPAARWGLWRLGGPGVRLPLASTA